MKGEKEEINRQRMIKNAHFIWILLFAVLMERFFYLFCLSFLSSSTHVSSHLPCPFSSFIHLLSLPLYSPPLNLSFWPLILSLTPPLPHSSCREEIYRFSIWISHFSTFFPWVENMRVCIQVFILNFQNINEYSDITSICNFCH